MSAASKRLDPTALAQLFHDARSYPDWRPEPVPEPILLELVTLTNLGPTSLNCCPGRLVFVRSDADKARLDPLVSAGNRRKVAAAPVTAILAYDTAFYRLLGDLLPHAPQAGGRFAADPDYAAITAFRNACLQGGYFIMAARALGLDTGPMSGFDNAALDDEFFPDGRHKSNFLCNIGYGDASGLRPRSPRPDYDMTVLS